MSATIMKTGNDPRTSVESSREHLGHIDLHNPLVSFEEYVYYASITRAEENIANEAYVLAQGPKSVKKMIMGRFSKGHHANATPVNESEVVASEKDGVPSSPNASGRGVTDAEWKQASRALRTCGWGSIFYLITTDILGPFSTPYVCPPPSFSTRDPSPLADHEK